MLKEKIQQDYLTAFKSKDRIAMDALSMLKAAIQYQEVEARSKGKELQDEDILNIIRAEAKKRKEAIESFQMAHRADAAQTEQEQLKVLSAYLPAMMDESELRLAIQQVVEQLQAVSMTDFGRVMKSASQELKGRAEGQDIKRMVELLLKEKA